MFADSSIKQRLILGFGFMLTLMAVLAFFIGAKVNHTKHLAELIAYKLTPQVEAADNLAFAVSKESTSLRGYILTGDQEYRQKFWNATTDRRNALSELETLVTAPKAEKQLAGIVADINEMNDVESNIFGLLNQNRKDAAYSLYESRVAKLSNSISGAADELAAFGHERVNNATEDFRESSIASGQVAIISFGVALLAALAVITVTVRSITRLTKKIAGAADAVAAGHYQNAAGLEETYLTKSKNGEVSLPRNELHRIAVAVGKMARELELREKNLTAYAEISSACATSIDIEPLLHGALAEMAQATNSQAAAVYVMERGKFCIKSTYGISSELAEEGLSDPRGLAQQALNSGEAVMITDIPGDTHFLIRPGLGQALPKVIVCVPMVTGSEKLGVVVLASWEGYDEENLSLIRAATSQLAVAVSNALSYKSIQEMAADLQEKTEELDAQNEELQCQNEEIQAQNEEIQTQYENIQSQNEEIEAQNEELAAQREELREHSDRLEIITNDLALIQSMNAVALSSMDQNEILNGLLDTIIYGMKLDFGFVKTVDTENNERAVVAMHGVEDPDDFRRYFAHKIVDDVLRSGQPVVIEDVQSGGQVVHPYIRRAGIGSAVAVPLITSGITYGVAILGSYEQKEVSNREMQLLLAFAERAASAIERTTSFARLEVAEYIARNERERLKAIIDNLPEGVVIVSAPDGKVFAANKRALALYGVDDLLDCEANEQPEAYQLYYPDGRLMPYEELPLTRSCHNGEICSGEEVVIQQPSGQRITILVNTVPIRGEDGSVTSAVAVFQDISDIKERERSLEHGYEIQKSIAQALQKSFLPEKPPIVDGYEIADAYIPAAKEAQVGGDFYDLIELGEDKLGVVMADVSGKGVGAAIYTAMTKYMLRAFAEQEESPGKVLERLNQALCKYMKGDNFITLFYGVLDTNSSTLTYANAGHEGPMVCREGEEECESLESTGPVLGIIPMGTYDEKEAHLASYDSLVLYTDGITEARNGDDFLGPDGFASILFEVNTEGAEIMTDRILTRVRDFTDKGLRDDVALVVIKATNGRTSKSTI